MRLADTLSPADASPIAALRCDVRAKAEAVLASLHAAKAECDRQLTQLRRSDAMKQVTGKSSLDEAIDSTKRLLAELDEAEAKHAGARAACEVEVRLTAPRHQTAIA